MNHRSTTRKKLALGAGVVVALLVIIGAATGSDEPAPTATPTPTATTQAARATQDATPTQQPTPHATTPPPVTNTPPPATEAPPATQAPPPVTQAPAPARTTLPRTGATPCVDVPPAKVGAILDVTKQGPLVAAKAGAVQSETGDWFIAIRVKVDGTEQVGVWQTKALDTPSRIGSVNAMARTLTNWPDTGNNGAKPARDAEKCIR